MTKPLFMMCAGMAVLGLAACHQSGPKSVPPGYYSKTNSSVDARGTQTTRTTDTNVYYDQYGNKRAIQETTTTRDPKGLFNKSTQTTTRTYN